MKTVTCRHCGTSGLSWRDINGRWRLFEGANLHRCGMQRQKQHQRLQSTVTSHPDFFVSEDEIEALQAYADEHRNDGALYGPPVVD